MALARRHVNGQKQVFCTKGHKILIFQYYSKNKYCADVADTPAYEVALNSVDWLLSYRPLTILTMRLYVSLLVHYWAQNRYFSTEYGLSVLKMFVSLPSIQIQWLCHYSVVLQPNKRLCSSVEVIKMVKMVKHLQYRFQSQYLWLNLNIVC